MALPPVVGWCIKYIHREDERKKKERRTEAGEDAGDFSFVITSRIEHTFFLQW